jgi:tRNA-specific 2-thiouridylase
MTASRRVAVAMSGGVDSAATAALLAEEGYRVRGLTARFWREQETDADIASARAVCDHLGITHEVLDLREAFYQAVVRRFVSDYAAARTPNPCICCNQELKFGLLLNHALAAGDELLATGHYARIVADSSGWQLLRGIDAAKDQSYFLYMLDQKRLSRLLLPLGVWRKTDLVVWATARGLPAASRGESQDVCFIADGDYRRFLGEHAPQALQPGPILDAKGRTLGQHRGLALYTVGQREGLGIAVGQPLYVTELDAERNALVVGPAAGLGSHALLAAELTFVAGSPPAPEVDLQAKIRSRAQPVACWLRMQSADTARVEFAASLRDVAPGQAIVVYNGDAVIGGGTIVRALPA